MNFDDIDVAPCLIAPDPANVDPSANAGEGQQVSILAATIPKPCGSIEGIPGELTIIPGEASVETGAEFPFIAVARLSNGVNLVVTTSARWWVSDETMAAVGEHTGVATSLLAAPVGGGSASASVVVRATYQSLEATAVLNCFSICGRTSLDIVLVLDRSGSMAQIGDNGITTLECVRTATQNLINAMRPTDMVGIVSFAGKMWQTAGLTHRLADATLISKLSNDKTALLASLDDYAIATLGEASPGNPIISSTGIGKGLELAQAELLSSRHRIGAERVIVLLTDGNENMEMPSPETPADYLKTFWATVIVTIGVNVPSTFVARLNALASTGKAYQITKAEDAIGIFSSLPNLICTEFGQPYGEMYYGDIYGYQYGSLYDLYGHIAEDDDKQEIKLDYATYGYTSDWVAYGVWSGASPPGDPYTQIAIDDAGIAFGKAKLAELAAANTAARALDGYAFVGYTFMAGGKVSKGIGASEEWYLGEPGTWHNAEAERIGTEPGHESQQDSFAFPWWLGAGLVYSKPI